LKIQIRIKLAIKENTGKIGIDSRQFEELFRKHFKGLSFFALEYVKDRDVAREIVQEAFARLWEKRNSIEIGKSPKSYLGTSVKNRALNYLRDNKKFDRSILEFEGLNGDEYDEKDHMVTEELKSRITETIEALPEKCREIFYKNRYENKKYQEIADELDISVKTVEAQMSKALRVLRERLSEFITVLILFIKILLS
jgi:RNA polymerase sigma-70 factor (ECF subfamily)